MFSRRFLLSALAVLPWVSAARAGTKEHAMYGLIGKFTAAEGQRDALMGYLVEGSQSMPGNQSYVVAADAGDEVTIWVTGLGLAGKSYGEPETGKFRPRSRRHVR